MRSWPPILAVGLLLAGTSAADPPATALTTTPASDLPPALRSAIQELDHYALQFDQPAVIQLLRFVQHAPHAPRPGQPAYRLEDWRVPLERPESFQGRVVTVTGEVGRHSRYRLPDYPELNPITQLELRHPRQPVACTVLLTNAPEQYPLGATVELTGYFVMVRQYYDRANHLRPALLVVAPAPTLVAEARPTPSVSPDWRWGLAAAVLGVFVAFVILRRAAGRPHRDPRRLEADRPAPLDLAEDLETLPDSPDEPNRR